MEVGKSALASKSELRWHHNDIIRGLFPVITNLMTDPLWSNDWLIVFVHRFLLRMTDWEWNVLIQMSLNLPTTSLQCLHINSQCRGFKLTRPLSSHPAKMLNTKHLNQIIYLSGNVSHRPFTLMFSCKKLACFVCHNLTLHEWRF